MRPMERLTDLPNIGLKLADNLEKIDVTESQQLREMGAEEAFLRIRAKVDATACLPPSAGGAGWGGGGYQKEPAAPGAQGAIERMV